MPVDFGQERFCASGIARASDHDLARFAQPKSSATSICGIALANLVRVGLNAAIVFSPRS